MRQIGTLPHSDDPQVFEDYLLSIGVTSRSIRSSDGWAVWVHDEDKVSRARQELDAYQQNPADPRFRSAVHTAAAIRERDEKLNREYRRNVRNLSGTWDRVQFRRRPLTLSLVVACVLMFLAQHMIPGFGAWTLDNLYFFSPRTLAANANPLNGLHDITSRLQVWRLVTPIFLHGNVVHLVLNMWMMVSLGTLIETRRGTRTLLWLVGVSAVVSNIAQFLFECVFNQSLSPWLGISGVAFALFGYVWTKGRQEPEQGMMLHRMSVRIMLAWLLLGLTGLFPMQMANGAHVGGLMIGMLMGLARF